MLPRQKWLTWGHELLGSRSVAGKKLRNFSPSWLRSHIPFFLFLLAHLLAISPTLSLVFPFLLFVYFASFLSSLPPSLSPPSCLSLTLSLCLSLWLSPCVFLFLCLCFSLSLSLSLPSHRQMHTVIVWAPFYFVTRLLKTWMHGLQSWSTICLRLVCITLFDGETEASVMWSLSCYNRPWTRRPGYLMTWVIWRRSSGSWRRNWK